MPDYNAALNVTYYSLPDLAWTYNSAAMPAAEPPTTQISTVLLIIVVPPD